MTAGTSDNVAVHERPRDLADDEVRRALSDGWGIEAEVAYAAVGFGSHHWIAVGRDARWFVTVDDLRHKPMLGGAPSAVLEQLASMHRAARELHGAGLEFVVAPLELRVSPDRPGACTALLDEHWAVSVLPHVDGSTWGFSDAMPPPQRDELVEHLARLHAAGRPSAALRTEIPPSGRAALESVLADGTAWDAGPFSAPARGWLAEHRDPIRARLAEVDTVAARIDAADLVVTHGEPHPGNLIGTAAGLRLVDWDTVALAPRERDLWLVGTDDATVSAYEDASGRSVDRELLAAYRLAWDLADVASFLDELRAPHDDTDDTRAAVRCLENLELAPLGS
jgi:spectinomycin phosphotransferase